MKAFLLLFSFLLVNTVFAQSALNGYGDTPWGSSYDQVKEKFVSLIRNPNSKENIQIVNESKDKLLVVKRVKKTATSKISDPSAITYIYRFYVEPEEVKELTDIEEGKKPDHKAANGLFSVGVVFGPVPSSRIKETLKKYGPPSKEYLVENSFGVFDEPKADPQKAETDPDDINDSPNTRKIISTQISAAFIWDLSSTTTAKTKDGGFIIQWNEPYQKKMYSKRIDYFSSELSSIINTDYKKYFSNRETKIIMDLLNTPSVSYENKEEPIKKTEEVKVKTEDP